MYNKRLFQKVYYAYYYLIYTNKLYFFTEKNNRYPFTLFSVILHSRM